MMVGMAKKNRITSLKTIRLTNRQLSALQYLPKGISVGILVRTLLDAYLNGHLPYVHALVIQEQERTENEADRTQFHRGE